MRVHLNHPNIKLDCVTDDKKIPISQKTIQPNLPSFSKYLNSSSRAADINRAVAGLIVSDMRPLGVVDNLEFKELLQKLDPHYVLPCRRHLADKIIPEMYSEKKEKLEKKLQKAQSIALTTDSGHQERLSIVYTCNCHSALCC